MKSIYSMTLFLFMTSILFSSPINDFHTKYKIFLKGLGKIKIGMTKSEIEKATGLNLGSDNSHGEGQEDGYACEMYELKKDKKELGISLMLTSEKKQTPKLGRIYISSKKIHTKSGIKIGDTIKKLLKTYPDNLKKESNHYTGTPIYVFTPKDKKDQNFRISFETDGKVITEISVGKIPEIEYVEGCS
ncbi:MAG: DUF1131 family protein [Leptospiraceae bacterium]|nr:DUF1131 family protein [Leptospiraceae bacterium]